MKSNSKYQSRNSHLMSMIFLWTVSTQYYLSITSFNLVWVNSSIAIISIQIKKQDNKIRNKIDIEMDVILSTHDCLDCLYCSTIQLIETLYLRNDSLLPPARVTDFNRGRRNQTMNPWLKWRWSVYTWCQILKWKSLWSLLV